MAGLKVKATLVKFIHDNFIKESGLVVNADDSLIEKGLIDSTGVLELVAFMEETFKIKVEDEEIIPENFDSVNKLVNFIQLKLKT
jgi:acyl carrier protein